MGFESLAALSDRQHHAGIAGKSSQTSKACQ
jgi:hypothetical protein